MIEHAGAAIVDDVRRFVSGEVGVDERQKQTGALDSPCHFEGAMVVDQEEGHLVPHPQSECEKSLRQLARPSLELAEGHRPSRRGDNRRPLGMRGGVGRGRVGRDDGFGGVSGAHASLLVAGGVPVLARRALSAPTGRPLPAAERHDHPHDAPNGHDPEVVPGPRRRRAPLEGCEEGQYEVPHRESTTRTAPAPNLGGM